MRRVIALGFFDGVHIGHGALLSRTSKIAAELGASPGALTFNSHPESLLSGRHIPLLVSLEERAQLMRSIYGIDEVLVAHFDKELMRLPWRDFVENRLVGEYGAIHLVAGHDFHFGYRGEGDPARLRSICSEIGLGCDIIPRVELDGVTVSSTYIRELLSRGEVGVAARFLGHPHILSGTVEKGRGVGHLLGFPTANIGLPAGIQAPANGVYATFAYTPDGRFPAMTNVGARPTMEMGGRMYVESCLFGYSGDLYGLRISVSFVKRLRDEAKFRSVDGLKAQIACDAIDALAALGE